jgi:hypothetical protein
MIYNKAQTENHGWERQLWAPFTQKGMNKWKATGGKGTRVFIYDFSLIHNQFRRCWLGN